MLWTKTVEDRGLDSCRHLLWLFWVMIPSVLLWLKHYPHCIPRKQALLLHCSRGTWVTEIFWLVHGHRGRSPKEGKKGVTSDVNSPPFLPSYSLHGLGHFLYTNMPQKCFKALLVCGEQMKIPGWKGWLNYSLLLLSRNMGWSHVHLRQAGFVEAWLPRGVSRDWVPVWPFLQKQSDSFHKNSVKKAKVGAGGRKQIKQSQRMKTFNDHDSCVLSHVFPRSEGQVGDKNLHPVPRNRHVWKSSKPREDLKKD